MRNILRRECAISELRQAIIDALCEIAKKENGRGVIYVQSIDEYVTENFDEWCTDSGSKEINELIDLVT